MYRFTMDISILGLPNSGKSTLINALAGKKISITHEEPNTTRDFVSVDINIDGTNAKFIDLPGYIDSPTDYLSIFQKNIEPKLKEASLILLVVDSKNPNYLDFDKLVKKIRKYDNKIWLLVNKVDDSESYTIDEDLYKYQFDKEFLISSIHKTGIPLLSENISNYLNENKSYSDSKSNEMNNLSIIGRPNVGKSSLFNVLLKYERSGVSEVPGTTIDIVNDEITIEGTTFQISDTAGVPRKKQKSNLERIASRKTLNQILISSVTLLVLDASDGVRVEDLKLISESINNYVTPIVVLNKWDLLESEKKEEVEKNIKHELHSNTWVKIIRTSSLNGRGIDLLRRSILEVNEAMHKRVNTSELNKFIRYLWTSTPPHPYRGKRAKIKYVNQYSTYPPSISFSLSGRIPENYKRFLSNRIREEFSFGPTSIRIKF